MNPLILRTLDEKVRYFRNILLGTDRHVRIIIGGENTGKIEALQLAVDDVEMGPHQANQICIIGDEPDYYMPVQEPRDSEETIFIYSSLDDSVIDHLSESEAKSCEIVVFEPASKT
jgi:hypothetical protein